MGGGRVDSEIAMRGTLLNRLQRDQSGFTLLELLVVTIILANLVAIAVPAYFALRGRAEDQANRSAVSEILPAVEAYFQDNTGYTGMTVALLKSTYDRSIDTTKYTLNG